MTEPTELPGLDKLVSDELASLFIAPQLPQERSAWYGHLPFAHWIIQHARPRRFVELGSHAGASYFAFCAAVSHFEIKAECFAVDTWQGDSQAGEYSDDVFNTVNAHNQKNFASFSSLIRSTFDEALNRFEDGSIDLLHIDGFHSYDAVSHDFTTWLPKLSERAVVLFHDTHEHKDGFGVWKFWEEIRQGYPWFEFEHSHGLGVLAVGAAAPGLILRLCEINKSARGDLIRARCAHLGGRWEAESLTRELRGHLGRMRQTLQTEQDVARKFLKAQQNLIGMRRAIVTAKRRAEMTEQKLVKERQRVQAAARQNSWRGSRPVRLLSRAKKLLGILTVHDGLDLLRTLPRPGELRRWPRRVMATQQILSSALFDPQWYAQQYPDAAGTPAEMARHYVKIGVKKGYQPSAHFDTRWYLQRYPDVARSGINPLYHYILHGKKDGREPLPTRRALEQPARRAVDKFPEGTRKLELSVASRLDDLDGFRQSVKTYQLARANRPKDALKIAVYTASIDHYDTIKQPAVLNPRFDYFLFTNEPVMDVGIFQVRPVTYFANDSTRTGRYIKTHPHQHFPDYDIAIWLDANIQIHGDFNELLDRFLSSNKPVAVVAHPIRSNVYDEASICIELSKDEEQIMQAQVDAYAADGFEHDDLCETNWMFFRLREASTQAFLTVWWREINRHSRRDQLSVNFAMQEAGIDWFRLTEPGKSVREDRQLAYVAHDGGEGVSQLLEGALGEPMHDPLFGPSFADTKQAAIETVSACQVDVVVCVHNALEDVRSCLESIVRHRSLMQTRLTIVDDGSDEETARFLRVFAEQTDWVSLIRNATAVGYTRAANQGMANTKGEMIILLNSDTIVTEHWAEKMAHTLFSTCGAGIVGPLSNAASHQSIPDIASRNGQTAINALPPGVSVDMMNTLCEQWSVDGLVLRVPLVHGFCMGISRDVLNLVGGFDESSFPHGYGEENDLCFRATDAGFALVLATNTFVFHAKSKSYDTERRERLMADGSRALHELHGSPRVSRSVKAMQNNPVLARLRSRAALLDRQARARLLAAKVLPAVAGPGVPAGSAYVRLLLPLSQAGVANIADVDVLTHQGRELPEPGTARIVYLQRDLSDVSLDNAQSWASAWREAGGQIIYDLDDDLLDINAVLARTGWTADRANTTHERVVTLLKLADVVTVSTATLADRVAEYAKDVRVLPNNLDQSLWPVNSPRSCMRGDTKDSNARPIRIGYIGTPSHDQDLAVIAAAVRQIEAEFGDQVRVEVVGAFRGKEALFGHIYDHGNASEYPQFVDWLNRNVHWDIGLIPLVDDDFNRSKSDLKFLEYAALGMAIVCSEVPAYSGIAAHERNCLVAANTKQQWVDAITRLIRDGELRARLSSAARTQVAGERTLLTAEGRYVELFGSVSGAIVRTA